MNGYESISYGGLLGIYRASVKAFDQAKADVKVREDALELAEVQEGIALSECEKWSALLDERERAAAA